MKKIITSLLYVFAVSVLFNSCESFLEEKPVDRYVKSNFYQGESDAEASVSAAYEQLYGIYERLMFLLSALPADDEKNGRGMPNPHLLNLEYLRIVSENDFTTSMWRENYEGILRANSAIANIPDISMDETIKERLIGEARFLRALFYFNLVRFYGDVPLLLNLESVQDAYEPRTAKAQVYEQIIADLTFAEDNLPVSYSSNEIGRATKGAAKILLGKVYLTKHDYSECVSKLAEVIEDESAFGYGLHESFGDNWEIDTENGIEMVFSVEFMDPPGKGNRAMKLQAPKFSFLGGGNFSLLGLSDGKEADIPTIDLYSKFEDEDERKAETFRESFISLTDGSVHIVSIPIFVKYWEDNEANPNNSDANMHVIRYADALLMYAEALNEVGQSDEAHTYLNRIRERAFNSSDHNYSGLSQQEFRIAVWKERRIELAMEGHRWFDLARTGRFIQRMRDHSEFEAEAEETEEIESNKAEIAENIKDYMILMPIPQREIDLNDRLIQNPGY